jgi:hypothetical protein
VYCVLHSVLQFAVLVCAVGVHAVRVTTAATWCGSMHVWFSVDICAAGVQQAGAFEAAQVCVRKLSCERNASAGHQNLVTVRNRQQSPWCNSSTQLALQPKACTYTPNPNPALHVRTHLTLTLLCSQRHVRTHHKVTHAHAPQPQIPIQAVI